MKFYSPSQGELDFQGVMDSILRFIKEMPGTGYKLVIGTDSCANQRFKTTLFATVIIIHRELLLKPWIWI